MSSYILQHYVPKFYFRLFSEKKNAISLMTKKKRMIIENSSIKGQCAIDNYYASKKTEQSLSKLETSFDSVLKKIGEISCEEELSDFLFGGEAENYEILLSCIVCQQARTLFQRDSIVDMHKTTIEWSIKALVQSGQLPMPPPEISLDQISVKVDDSWAATMSLVLAIAHIHLIKDLRIQILNNKSEIPFVFSDNPVVLYSKEKRRSIGFGSSGLMIYYPISTTKAVLLSDPSVYKGPYKEPMYIDIGRFDVKQLNDMQFLSASNNIYCGVNYKKGFDSISKSLDNSPPEFCSNIYEEENQGVILHFVTKPIQYNFSPTFLKTVYPTPWPKKRNTINWGLFNAFCKEKIDPLLEKFYQNEFR